MRFAILTVAASILVGPVSRLPNFAGTPEVVAPRMMSVAVLMAEVVILVGQSFHVMLMEQVVVVKQLSVSHSIRPVAPLSRLVLHSPLSGQRQPRDVEKSNLV